MTTPRPHTRSFLRIAALLLACASGAAVAVDRFPRPQFEGGHVVPTATHPHPLPNIFAYVDVAVLVIALLAAAYFALQRRSRPGVLLTSIASLLYFGLWRNGCVCAVGSIQNITLTLFDATYAVPITVIAFFALPLVFALVFGRVFCAAVCPLGALQDLAIVKPMRVPRWLARALGMIPYVYLALAVLFAATRSVFIICAYDPYVALFRLGGWTSILLYGACFLVIGMFVARPYCRFLCPYGVLLNWFSRLSRWHVTITPDDCIQCRLCEDACPFGAILKPTEARTPETLPRERRRLILSLLAVPVLMVCGAWLGMRMAPILSCAHPTVKLAAQLHLEETGRGKKMTLQSEAFRATGTPIATVYRDADAIRGQFRFGSAIAGAFVGGAMGMTMVSLCLRRRRTDYEPDRGACVSCGRCFNSCPREHVRLAQKKGGSP